MRRRLKFAGWFGLITGVLMVVQWTFFLVSSQVPEIRTEPIRLSFHLAGELATALALIVSGWAVLRSIAWGHRTLLVAIGMLTYTVVVSPGYFAQQGQWIFLGMFGLLLVLAITSTVILIRATPA